MLIERNFQKFLLKLIKEKAEDNLVAKALGIVYKQIKGKDKKGIYEQIESNYELVKSFDPSKIETGNTVDYTETLKGKDFLINEIALHSMRRFPPAKGGKYFHIDLRKGNMPGSAIIYGPNNSGKSTIFSALQYIFTNRLSEAEHREVENDGVNYFSYLKHKDHTPFCEVTTNAGQFTLQKKVINDEIVNPVSLAHFISEAELHEAGQLSYLSENSPQSSFHQLVAQSLGLQEYLDFLKQVKDLSKYRRTTENNRINGVKKEIESLGAEVREKKDEINILSKKLHQVSTDVLNITNDTVSAIRQLENLRNDYAELTLPKSTIGQKIEELNGCYGRLLANKIGNVQADEASFLSKGLNFLDHTDDCPFCHHSKLSTAEIRLYVEEKLSAFKIHIDNEAKYSRALSEYQFETNLLNETLKRVDERLIADLKSLSNFPGLKAVIEPLKALHTFYSNRVFLFPEYGKAEEQEILTSDFQQQILKSGKQMADDYLMLRDAIIKLRDRFLKIIQAELDTLQIGPTNPIVEKEILEREIVKRNREIETKSKQISDRVTELDGLQKTVLRFQEIKDSAALFVPILEKEIIRITNDAFVDIKDDFQKILRSYFLENENLEVRITLKNETSIDDQDEKPGYLTIELVEVNKETGEVLHSYSPKQYFNTFRFKLFCLTVRLVVLIAIRRLYDVNFPVVIDDLFYSSDYVAKREVIHFIRKIILLFRNFDSTHRLQLIVLTHDDVIFDWIYDAIEYIDDKDFNSSANHAFWHRSIKNSVLFARLLKPEETMKDSEKWHELLYKLPELKPIIQELANET